MKKLAYLLLIVLLTSCATIKPELFFYRDFPAEKDISVVNSKNDLFIGANTWLIQSFNDAANIVKYSDEEAGVIVGKYLMRGTYSAGTTYISELDNRIFAVISIMVKDNATKIKIVPEGIGKYYKPNQETYYTLHSSPTGEKIKKEAEDMIADYETFILKYKVW